MVFIPTQTKGASTSSGIRTCAQHRGGANEANWHCDAHRQIIVISRAAATQAVQRTDLDSSLIATFNSRWTALISAFSATNLLRLPASTRHTSDQHVRCRVFTAQQPRLKVGIGRYVDKPTPRARNSSCASASVSSAAIQERRAPSRESRCGPVGGAACRGEGNRHLVRSGLGSHSV